MVADPQITCFQKFDVHTMSGFHAVNKYVNAADGKVPIARRVVITCTVCL